LLPRALVSEYVSGAAAEKIPAQCPCNFFIFSSTLPPLPLCSALLRFLAVPLTAPLPLTHSIVWNEGISLWLVWPNNGLLSSSLMLHRHPTPLRCFYESRSPLFSHLFQFRPAPLMFHWHVLVGVCCSDVGRLRAFRSALTTARMWFMRVRAATSFSVVIVACRQTYKLFTSSRSSTCDPQLAAES